MSFFEPVSESYISEVISRPTTNHCLKKYAGQGHWYAHWPRLLTCLLQLVHFRVPWRKALYNLPLNLRSTLSNTPVIALLQILRFPLRLSNVLLPHKPVTILPIMTCYPSSSQRTECSTIQIQPWLVFVTTYSWLSINIVKSFWCFWIYPQLLILAIMMHS